jgi:two-component system cell cycle sensor histidine kinase PleC
LGPGLPSPYRFVTITSQNRAGFLTSSTRRPRQDRRAFTSGIPLSIHTFPSSAAPCKTAGQIALALPALSVRQTCGEVFTWLQANPQLPAIAILNEHGHVEGLVNRLIYLARYARPYAPELYSRKPILTLANRAPLIVDENVMVTDLGAMLLAEDPHALIECFVVTRHGRYSGIGTGEGLLRSKVDHALAREADLHQALGQATASSKAKGDFLALMSHELRTPLNAIIGFSEVLGSELFGPLGNPRYKEYSRDIHGAGKHLLALINDILDLSKAEAGKFDLTDEEIVPADLLTECLRLMRVKAEEAGLRLEQQLAPGLPNLVVDRLRLKQILLNLLSNAIKFTPAGGAVTLAADHAGSGVFRICVRDTGIGMAPDAIPLALEPFRQIASPLSRTQEGTGLGLALVKSLIECHGGKLELDSAVNQGTTARLIIPASRCISKRNALSA